MYAVSMTMIIKKEKLAENTPFNISQPLSAVTRNWIEMNTETVGTTQMDFFNNFNNQNILSDFPIEIVFH